MEKLTVVKWYVYNFVYLGDRLISKIDGSVNQPLLEALGYQVEYMQEIGTHSYPDELRDSQQHPMMPNSLRDLQRILRDHNIKTTQRQIEGLQQSLEIQQTYLRKLQHGS